LIYSIVGTALSIGLGLIAALGRPSRAARSSGRRCCCMVEGLTAGAEKG